MVQLNASYSDLNRFDRSILMRKSAKIRKGFLPLAGLAAFCGPAIPTVAQDKPLQALDKLAAGSWEIRYRSDNTRQRICLHNGRELIQLRHPQSGCNRFIVEDTADRVTVQYTCQGHGYGRTDIRRETPNIVQIESQGVADGLPFQFSAEARRSGAC